MQAFWEFGDSELERRFCVEDLVSVRDERMLEKERNLRKAQNIKSVILKYCVNNGWILQIRSLCLLARFIVSRHRERIILAWKSSLCKVLGSVNLRDVCETQNVFV